MPRREACSIDKAIGANVQRIRTMKGMSQAQLGDALTPRMSSQALLKWEDGRTRIPAAALVDLSKVLDCKVVELFHDVQGVPVAEQPGKIAEGLFKHFNTIESEPVQRAIANLVKAITIELSEGMKP